jgi:hypothetical protein
MKLEEIQINEQRVAEFENEIFIQLIVANMIKLDILIIMEMKKSE